MEDERKVKSKLTLVLDDVLTIHNERITLNLFNVNKQPEIFECDPKQLSFYISNTKVEVDIHKSSELHNGLRIVAKEKLTEIEWINWIIAIKDNNFTISHNKGEVGYIVKLLNDKASDSATQAKMKEKVIKQSNRLVDEFWTKIGSSQKNSMFNLKNAYEELGGVISYVDETHSTQTSLRLQLIFPADHPRREMFKPGEIPTKFYHHFDGHLYEMNTTFLQGVGDFFEWDITGLTPGRSYVGLSFSTDGGNNILPSTSLFGVTKNENGDILNIDEAPLEKPLLEAGYAKHKMWPEELALKFMGKELTKTTYDIMVKKEHEFKNDDIYVPIANIDEYYDDYPWIKTGKEI